MSVDPYPIDDGSAAEQAWFFRAADRLRLEGYISALTHSGMSLSLVSSHDAILDHYGKLLIARLREVAPDFDIEVYFPASSEALIERFNHVLHDYSVAQAMAGKAVSAPPKVWIVHDASALPDHEIQLLARLVQNFPGANIRIVMLITHASQKQPLLNSFGRRILSWDIEAPNAEQRLAMLAQARAQGREASVNALLLELGTQAPAPTLETAGQALRSKPEQAQTVKQSSPQSKAKKNKTALWLLWGGLLLAVCSLGVTHWYNKTTLPDLILLAWDYVRAGGYLSTAAAPAPTGVRLDERGGSVPLPTPDITTQAAQDAAKEIEEILVNPSQARVGQSWLLYMAMGTYVVIHNTEPSFQEANAWLQSHAHLKFAQIVAHTPPSQSRLHFSVVSGPFVSITEARGYLLNSTPTSDARVISSQSLQEQFSSESASTSAAGTQAKQ